MERDSGHGDEHGIAPVLASALAGLDAQAGQVIAEVIVLYREVPAWAVWLPSSAVRPASGRVPGPELPMV